MKSNYFEGSSRLTVIIYRSVIIYTNYQIVEYITLSNMYNISRNCKGEPSLYEFINK